MGTDTDIVFDGSYRNFEEAKRNCKKYAALIDERGLIKEIYVAGVFERHYELTDSGKHHTYIVCCDEEISNHLTQEGQAQLFEITKDTK